MNKTDKQLREKPLYRHLATMWLAVAIVAGAAFGAPDSAHAETAQEELQREIDEMEARQARITQLVVGVIARGGVRGMYSGLDNPSDEDYRSVTTNTWSLGARITKGLVKQASVDLEVSGGRTGTGVLEDINYKSMVGEVERSAVFARVGGGTNVRFGDTIMPYGSFGLGLKVFNYDSTFTVDDGAAMEGPGDGLAMVVQMEFSVGVDVRVGDLLIGVEGNSEAALFGPITPRALTLGVHVGMGL